MKTRMIVLCGACVFAIAGKGYAINGTQSTAYGAKAAGMGGASVAFPQDAIAAANNPAGMAEVGTRFDGDVQFLYAHWDTTFMSEENKNQGTVIIPVPEFGINYQLDDKWSLGFSTAGSGAGFSYDEPLVPNAGMHKAKGTLQQVVGLPTLAYKVNDHLSVGLSLGLAVQRFNIQGVPSPDGRGEIPGHSYQMAYGLGWRTGALWKVNDFFSVGATYASKIKMGELDGYKNDILAPAGGSLDMPEQYALGIAVRPTDKLTFALDWQHISWDNVTAYHRLFGWHAQDIYRAGVAYEINQHWTVRTGVSYAPRVFDSDFTTQNVLLVGINSNSASVGVSRNFDGGGELTLGFEYDIGSKANGTGASSGTSIDTDFSFLTVGYGWKF